jgi:hypothetical protein
MPETTASRFCDQPRDVSHVEDEGNRDTNKGMVGILKRQSLGACRINVIEVERCVWSVTFDVLSFDGERSVHRFPNLNQLINERTERCVLSRSASRSAMPRQSKLLCAFTAASNASCLGVKVDDT